MPFFADLPEVGRRVGGRTQPPSAAYGYPRVRAALGQPVVPPVEAWKMVNKRGYYPDILGLDVGFPSTIAGLAAAVPGESPVVSSSGTVGLGAVSRGAFTRAPGTFTRARGAFVGRPTGGFRGMGNVDLVTSEGRRISIPEGASDSALAHYGLTRADVERARARQASMAADVPGESGGSSIFGDVLGFIPKTLTAGLNIAQAVPDLMDAFDDPSNYANRKAALACAQSGGTWTGKTCDLAPKYAAQASANDWAKSLLPIAGVLGGAYVLGKLVG